MVLLLTGSRANACYNDDVLAITHGFGPRGQSEYVEVSTILQASLPTHFEVWALYVELTELTTLL